MRQYREVGAGSKGFASGRISAPDMLNRYLDDGSLPVYSGLKYSGLRSRKFDGRTACSCVQTLASAFVTV